MNVLSWVLAHWQEIAGSVGVVVLAASMLVKVLAKYTDTKKDDELADWLVKVYGWLDKYVAVNTPQPPAVQSKLAALKAALPKK
mgnify:CR=1 FL=1